MTRTDGKCCGNCDAFMPDPFQWGEQGACAVIDDDCIAYGVYNWVLEEGYCEGWVPRRERPARELPRAESYRERMLYEKRMKGDWS